MVQQKATRSKHGQTNTKSASSGTESDGWSPAFKLAVFAVALGNKASLWKNMNKCYEER